MGKPAQAPFQVGKECFLRVQARIYRSKILGVAKDTIWVSFDDQDHPRQGTVVELEFHDGQGHIAYHTQVVIEPKQRGDGIVLQRASGDKFMKHRRSWRVPTDLVGSVRALNNGHVYQARLVDLSSEGALVETPAEFEVASFVDLTLAFPQRPPHTIKARVVHDSSGQTHGLLYRFGVRFTEIPRDAQRSLTLFLWKRIRELYPAELNAIYASTRRRPAHQPTQ